MAEEAQENYTPKSDVKEEAATHDIESQIQIAMRSRVSYFKEQADSLTLEKVRRLLEKDLGLEIYALDKHKRYIKQGLEKCLDGSHDTDASKNSVETGGERIRKGDAAESLEEHQLKKDVKEPCLEDEEKTKDSPVMGLLTGHKQAKLSTEEIKNSDRKGVPSEITIMKAIKKRASYFKANSDKVTMTEVRRLLENDLKLDEHSLDTCKKLISQHVEEILSSSEVSKSAPVAKKKSDSRASKKVSSKESSDSADSESDEEEGDEEKPKKRTTPIGKMQKSDGLKKRKRPTEETVPVKKQSKSARPVVEDDSDEDGHSQSSGEKPVKKKEVSTPAYGKRVEHLKSVIKSCGMSVPPSVYKKVKQVPENKRESQLIEELEEILSKEGLSSNPSEKEIKEVKKKKERAKELEGIDTSNIVSSSRRRSTTSFVPPPKPKMEVESDNDDSEEEEDDDDDDDDDDDEEVDEDNDNNEEDEDVEDNGDGSQSEDGVNEVDGEASD